MSELSSQNNYANCIANFQQTKKSIYSNKIKKLKKLKKLDFQAQADVVARSSIESMRIKYYYKYKPMFVSI